MKKLIFTFLFAYSIQAGYAQDSQPNVSGGTWVVESNISSPKDQIVKFYNSKLELVYEERVSDRKIRYEKERIKKALNRTLEIALKNDKKIEPGTFVAVLRTKQL